LQLDCNGIAATSDDLNSKRGRPLDLQLIGKTALVTGSTAGIGFAIARTLAREGTSIIITGRTQDRVDNAARRIREEIGDAKVSGIATDLATARGTAKCIEAVPSVDILVNNLGMYEPKPFEKITDDDWHSIIGLAFHHRDKLHERRSAMPALPATHEDSKLGSHHFHLQRVRREHSS